MRNCSLGVWIAVVLASAARGEAVRIRVLATTDLHGNIFPYDYYGAKPAARGLAAIATLIARERAGNPNTLLIDCGDTIQGSPLEGVHQFTVKAATVKAGANGPPDPMMLAMNKLGYDAMTVGNHEFNFGIPNLERARKAARFPWLGANIAGALGFQPYLVKTVGGVRVAVIGITTPSIPLWEKEENYRGLRFTDPVAAVRKAVAELRGKADLIVVAAHSGLDRDPVTGAPRAQDLVGENSAYQLAQVAGVNAVVFGHTHNEVSSYRVGKVLMMQPRNWGMSLGEMDFRLERTATGWRALSETSRTIAVTDSTVPDENVLALARPYHEAAERYLQAAVADAPAAMTTALARVEDTALIDAVQEVQMAAAKADVSFASAFDLGVKIGGGKVKVREIAALYPYDNTLYAVEGNGRMVREALENAARYYQSCRADCSAPFINKEVIGYNYDIAEGVDYEIDLRRPAGSRIVNLKWHGRALEDGQPLRIAVNSYRAGGSGGYTMFRGAKIVWRSTEEIREMMVGYFTAKGSLPAAASDNWRVTPAAAQVELRREAMEEAARPVLK